MVTSLAATRGTTLNLASSPVFATAVLIVLSIFAKDTARVFLDLPSISTTPVKSSVSPIARFPTPVAAHVATRPKPLAQLRTGMASWYGKVLEDHRTASGRRFHMFELTAAHRDLPFGSKVRVTNLRNRKSVVVTITDRGVLKPDRVIDLSYGAAEQLDMIKSGVDRVRLDVLTGKQALLAEAVPPARP